MKKSVVQQGQKVGMMNYWKFRTQCLMCSKGCYNTGVIDKICQLCYPSCYQCEGRNIDDCTDCGDPNIYHKQLIAGKCVCALRTIEYIQNDGTTLCLPCHSRCEKCYLPDDTGVYNKFLNEIYYYSKLFQQINQIIQQFSFIMNLVIYYQQIVIQLINIAQCVQHGIIELFLINLIVFVNKVMARMAYLIFVLNVITHVKTVMGPQQLIAQLVHLSLIVIQLQISSVYVIKHTLILETTKQYVYTFAIILALIVISLEKINAQVVQLQDNPIELEQLLNFNARKYSINYTLIYI